MYLEGYQVLLIVRAFSSNWRRDHWRLLKHLIRSNNLAALLPFGFRLEALSAMSSSVIGVA